MFCLLATLTLISQPIALDESLHARRIMALWEDKNYGTAMQQIEQFGHLYPKSILLDRFRLMHGDLTWSQGDYATALAIYDAISSPELKEQSFAQLMDCLYQEKQLDKLATALKDRYEQQERWIFYYAEALHGLNQDSETSQRLYLKLLDSPYALQSRLALAELSGPAEAAEHYLALSDAFPTQREAFLLRAAQLQLTYSPDEALLTLSKMQIGNEGAETPSMAVAQAWLLFESGQYDHLLLRQAKLEAAVSAKQRPILDYFVGRSYFNLGRYEEAITLLEPLLQQQALAFSDEKQLLFLVITSAKQLRQMDKLVLFTQRFADYYPEDELLPKVQLVLALGYKESEQPAIAEEMLQTLVSKLTPPSAEGETAAIELGLLQLQGQQLGKSHDTLKQLLNNYPNSRYQKEALAALALIAIQRLDSYLPTEPPIADWHGQEELLGKLCDDPEALPRIRFALGCALESQGKTDEACAAYRHVLKQSRRDIPVIRDSTQLRLARLLYPSAPQASLDLLKQLQVHRRLDHEPVHLEAAYDYARWKAAFAPANARNRVWLEELARARNEWGSTEDIWSKDYQTLRTQRPDKERLYQAYLILFDARIAQLQSELALENGDRLAAQLHREASRALYRVLTQEHFAISKYLVDQAQSGIHEESK